MNALAVLFDLDGVISDTATIHAKAWKIVFDRVLAADGRALSPFGDPDDYLQYLDGKTRQAGIEDFLRSRSIELPLGDAASKGIDSVFGIGNTKNAAFLALLNTLAVTVFPDARRLIDGLARAGIEIGLASSSKNARTILERTGLTGRFKAILDGRIAENEGIASKPHPAFYSHAAKLLGRSPEQCIVIEDAVSGVVSAKQAGAGLVVGIARHGNDAALHGSGADVVVASLDDLALESLLGTPIGQG